MYPNTHTYIHGAGLVNGVHLSNMSVSVAAVNGFCRRSCTPKIEYSSMVPDDVNAMMGVYAFLELALLSSGVDLVWYGIDYSNIFLYDSCLISIY